MVYLIIVPTVITDSLYSSSNYSLYTISCYVYLYYSITVPAYYYSVIISNIFCIRPQFNTVDHFDYHLFPTIHSRILPVYGLVTLCISSRSILAGRLPSVS